MTTPLEPPSSVFDLGLQLERTALAWRRTTLSVTVAALASIGLVVPLSPPWAGVLVSSGLAAAALMSLLAARRHTISAAALLAAPGPVEARLSVLPGGLPLAVVAFTQVVAGLGAFTLLLSYPANGL